MKIRRALSTAKQLFKKGEKTSDARYALMKKILYDPKVETFDPIEAKIPQKLSPNPPVYQGEDEELKQEDLIEREWSLYQIEKMQDFIDQKRKQFEMMRNANLHLEKTNKVLFNDTLERDGLEFKRFPKRLRIPTDSPPELGWDYEMDRNKE
jgi:hypothetical protein